LAHHELQKDKAELERENKDLRASSKILDSKWAEHKSAHQNNVARLCEIMTGNSLPAPKWLGFVERLDVRSEPADMNMTLPLPWHVTPPWWDDGDTRPFVAPTSPGSRIMSSYGLVESGEAASRAALHHLDQLIDMRTDVPVDCHLDQVA